MFITHATSSTTISTFLFLFFNNKLKYLPMNRMSMDKEMRTLVHDLFDKNEATQN